MTAGPAAAGPGHAPPTVARRVAAFWGLGTFATTTMLNGVSLVLLFYLVNFVKLEPVIAGGLLFGSKLVDALTDPPMGLLSDRTRSRWGRRRPYLLGASFFCGLAFAWLFNVPEALGGAGIYLYVGAGLVLYTLAYTAFQVPYMAMPAEMTDDYHERTQIMSYRVVFMTLGNMLGSAGCPFLVARLGGDRAAYGQMALIVGGVICAAMLATFLGTAQARQTPAGHVTTPLRRHVGWILQNRPLLFLMASKVIVYAGVSAFTSVMLFFFSNVLKRGPEMLALYAAIFALTTICVTPLWTRLARGLEKKTGYLLSFAGYLVGIATWLSAGPSESLAWFAARAAFLGIFNAGLFLFGNSMLIDTFAYDHRISGLRREGFLSSAFSFVEKTALALGPLIIGALLSTMGFDKSLPPGADQPPGAVDAMYLGFIWIPIAAQLGAIACLAGYRLDRRMLAVPAPGAERHV